MVEVEITKTDCDAKVQTYCDFQVLHAPKWHNSQDTNS